MPDPQPQQSLPHPDGVLHEIRWNEICPWLILVKALRVTLLIRVLVLATIGVMLTQWGDAAIDRFFSEGTSLRRQTTKTAFASQFAQRDFELNQPEDDAFELVRPQSSALWQGWQWVAKPFWLLANRELSWQSSLILLLHGFWTIVVWAVFGGAIARIAALYLTRGETLGPLVALRDAVTVWPSTSGAPLIVLLATIALAVPLVLLGTLLRLNSLAVIAGLLWCFVLAWGLMLAVVLVGLLVGWPLMWACLGVERSDAFDGVSRCYAYVYQRPLHLAFFVLVAMLLGFLGEAVVAFFAAATVTLSEETLSWGVGNARLAELLGVDGQNSGTLLATRAINGWKGGLESLVDTYRLACLWPMAVGIYLLLRRLVDATEMDEVTLSEVTLSADGAQSLPTRDPTAPA